jgi:hypothetical protein
VAIRLLLASIAVLVLAWTGVLLRDDHVGREAAVRSFFTSSGQSPIERERDFRRLADAELLDPSSYWALARASNRLKDGNLPAAARMAEQLVRDEPQNLLAWSVLAAATRGVEPARSAQAAEEIKRLNPFGSR